MPNPAVNRTPKLLRSSGSLRCGAPVPVTFNVRRRYALTLIMQKAIIIQSRCYKNNRLTDLDTTELNKHFADGWRFVSAAPLGVSVSNGGETTGESELAAILIIIEHSNK